MTNRSSQVERLRSKNSFFNVATDLNLRKFGLYMFADPPSTSYISSSDEADGAGSEPGAVDENTGVKHRAEGDRQCGSEEFGLWLVSY